MRGALGIGRGEKRRHRMIAEIEFRPLDRRVDDGQALDALVAQRRAELGERGDVAPAERAVQAAEHRDQQRLLAAEIVDCDLALARDRVEHDVGCPFARLQRADIGAICHQFLLRSVRNGWIAH